MLHCPEFKVNLKSLCLFLIINKIISLTPAVLTLQNADYVLHINAVIPSWQIFHRVVCSKWETPHLHETMITCLQRWIWDVRWDEISTQPAVGQLAGLLPALIPAASDLGHHPVSLWRYPSVGDRRVVGLSYNLIWKMGVIFSVSIQES